MKIKQLLLFCNLIFLIAIIFQSVEIKAIKESKKALNEKHEDCKSNLSLMGWK